MKGPEELSRFFDPTLSLNFNRRLITSQTHPADQTEMKPTNGASPVDAEVAARTNSSTNATNATLATASTSWRVDPRRLRLKALFNDLSQAELATANALGISFPCQAAESDASELDCR